MPNMPNIPNIEVTVSNEVHDVAHVHVKGTFDSHTADQVEKILLDLFQAGNHRMAVNLSEVEYISAAGISVLLNLQSLACQQDGEFFIINPSQQVNGVLELLALDKIFTVIHNIDNASKSIFKVKLPN